MADMKVIKRILMKTEDELAGKGNYAARVAEETKKEICEPMSGEAKNACEIQANICAAADEGDMMAKCFQYMLSGETPPPVPAEPAPATEPAAETRRYGRGYYTRKDFVEKFRFDNEVVPPAEVRGTTPDAVTGARRAIAGRFWDTNFERAGYRVTTKEVLPVTTGGGTTPIEISLGARHSGVGGILSVPAPLGESVTDTKPGFGVKLQASYDVLHGKDMPIGLFLGGRLGWLAYYTPDLQNVDGSSVRQGNVNMVDAGAVVGIYEKHRYIGVEVLPGYRHVGASNIARGIAGPGDLSIDAFNLGAALCGGYSILEACIGGSLTYPNYYDTGVRMRPEASSIRVEIPMFQLETVLKFNFGKLIKR